jgi:hypothetical protein
VRVGAEQEVSYFVRDGEADKRRHVGCRFAGEPRDTIRVDRGERSRSGRCIDQRVAKL